MRYVMRIIYFDSRYNQEYSMNVFGGIDFDNGNLKFASMGHRYSIPVEQVISIEPIED